MSLIRRLASQAAATPRARNCHLAQHQRRLLDVDRCERLRFGTHEHDRGFRVTPRREQLRTQAHDIGVHQRISRLPQSPVEVCRDRIELARQKQRVCGGSKPPGLRLTRRRQRCGANRERSVLE